MVVDFSVHPEGRFQVVASAVGVVVSAAAAPQDRGKGEPDEGGHRGMIMKDLTKGFLSQTEREKIIETVKEAEELTSGEILPMVVSASYHYPMANVVGGGAMALPLSIALTPLTGGLFWMEPQNMWVFIALFAVLFFVFHEIVKRVRWLKRLFISKEEMEEEVKESAITHFFREGLHRTRDETGILIFISVFEKRVWVLADRGINSKVHGGQWEEIVHMVVKGIKEGRQAHAICQAVQKVGLVLREFFPIRSGDTNELDNLIVKE